MVSMTFRRWIGCAALAASAFLTIGGAQAQQPGWCRRLRGRAPHRRRRQDHRELRVRRRERPHLSGGGSRPDKGSSWRVARGPDRQDGDAGNRRCPYAHAHRAAGARGSAAAQGLLRRRRRHQHGAGQQRRRISAAAGSCSGRSPLENSGPRHNSSRAWPNRSAVLGDDGGRGAEGCAGARCEESRHGEDLGRRSRREVQEADARALRRDHRRSA